MARFSSQKSNQKRKQYGDATAPYSTGQYGQSMGKQHGDSGSSIGADSGASVDSNQSAGQYGQGMVASMGDPMMPPHMHALTLASATHLHKLGHITTPHLNSIKSVATRHLQSAKSLNKGMGVQKPLVRFGSFVPGGASPGPGAPMSGGLGSSLAGMKMPQLPQYSPGKRMGRVTRPREG